MLVILMFIVSVGVMPMGTIAIISLHMFLLNKSFTDYFHHIDDAHIRIDRLFQRIVNPAVGLPTHIDEQVTVRNPRDIQH